MMARQDKGGEGLHLRGAQVATYHTLGRVKKGGNNTDSRVNSETKTRVSTSGDRGGRAQAVKLGEVLFGRTVG